MDAQVAAKLKLVGSVQKIFLLFVQLFVGILLYHPLKLAMTEIRLKMMAALIFVKLTKNVET